MASISLCNALPTNAMHQVGCKRLCLQCWLALLWHLICGMFLTIFCRSPNYWSLANRSGARSSRADTAAKSSGASGKGCVFCLNARGCERCSMHSGGSAPVSELPYLPQAAFRPAARRRVPPPCQMSLEQDTRAEVAQEEDLAGAPAGEELEVRSSHWMGMSCPLRLQALPQGGSGGSAGSLGSTV